MRVSVLLSDRGGIGMEELKKRKADEELQNYRRKVQMKQQGEKKSIEDFRYDIKPSSWFLTL